jgi:hypothetical protein
MVQHIGSKDLLKFLHVAVWIIFVGLCIEVGALIVNFVISLYKPEFIENLYKKLDLTGIYEQSKWVFYQIYSLIIAVGLLKAYLFYVVLKLVRKLDLSNPFTLFVSDTISEISYYTFSIGIVSYVARQTSKRLQYSDVETSNFNEYWADSQSFILMAAVIYIIAVIFKRGIEIQSENDLTV